MPGAIVARARSQKQTNIHTHINKHKVELYVLIHTAVLLLCKCLDKFEILYFHLQHWIAFMPVGDSVQCVQYNKRSLQNSFPFGHIKIIIFWMKYI